MRATDDTDDHEEKHDQQNQTEWIEPFSTIPSAIRTAAGTA
jgi:hypothetical protein